MHFIITSKLQRNAISVSSVHRTWTFLPSLHCVLILNVKFPLVFFHGWVDNTWCFACFILSAAVLKSSMKNSINYGDWAVLKAFNRYEEMESEKKIFCCFHIFASSNSVNVSTLLIFIRYFSLPPIVDKPAIHRNILKAISNTFVREINKNAHLIDGKTVWWHHQHRVAVHIWIDQNWQRNNFNIIFNIIPLKTYEYAITAVQRLTNMLKLMQ